jgi:hypothetical protein
VAGQVADHEADGGVRYFQPVGQLAHRQRTFVLQVGQQGEVPGGRSSPCRAAGIGSRFARPTSRGINSSIDRTAWAVVIPSLALISSPFYLCFQIIFGDKRRSRQCPI